MVRGGWVQRGIDGVPRAGLLCRSGGMPPLPPNRGSDKSVPLRPHAPPPPQPLPLTLWARAVKKYTPPPPTCPFGRAVLKNPQFFMLRTALSDCPQGPTANRQPPTANRHQPPAIIQYRFCGFVSCPCLGHETESVSVNVRFCWRYEHGGRLPVRPDTNPPHPPLDPPTHTSQHLLRTGNLGASSGKFFLSLENLQNT